MISGRQPAELPSLLSSLSQVSDGEVVQGHRVKNFTRPGRVHYSSLARHPGTELVPGPAIPLGCCRSAAGQPVTQPVHSAGHPSQPDVTGSQPADLHEREPVTGVTGVPQPVTPVTNPAFGRFRDGARAVTGWAGTARQAGAEQLHRLPANLLGRGPQHRDRRFHLRRHQSAIDSTRSMTAGADDRPLRRQHEVNSEIVVIAGQRLVENLQLMHRRDDGRIEAQQPRAGQQRQLDVGVTAPPCRSGLLRG